VDSGSAFAESCRALRTNLRHLDEHRAHCIMITSALPREGKSVVAANLAVACANGHRNVLLVDANLRHPAQHECFGVRNTVGLAQALKRSRPGEDCSQEVMVHQALSSLDVLTSGPLPASPPDDLASDAMTRLVEFFKTRYNLIIFDSAPVLPVTDALVLARHVDGIILVIKAVHTRREQADEAIKQLTRANSNLLGVVLNSVNGKKIAGRNGYPYPPPSKGKKRSTQPPPEQID
jgi:capsular exopolysaccharide synthesis family protein